MKRRQFFQFLGLGSIGYVVATQKQAWAHVIRSSSHSPDTELASFEFQSATLNPKGQIRQYQSHTATFFSESLSSAPGLDMVAIAPGQFWMGSSSAEPAASATEFPRHRVSVAPFYLSKYPVTQAQWAVVAAWPKVHRELPTAPAHFPGSQHPVESISWLEAVEFCDRLSRHTGRPYQLPTEAQWEYACRAGTQTPFHTGATITSQFADYIGTETYHREAVGLYRQTTIPVGHFTPNGFGLHDMHGNVWEWCADAWQTTYRHAPQLHPRSGQSQPVRRAIRGGSWSDTPARLRAASRSGYVETGLNRTIGFRVSLA